MLADDMPAIPLWYGRRPSAGPTRSPCQDHRVRHHRPRQPLAEVGHPKEDGALERGAIRSRVVGLPAQCRQADGLPGQRSETRLLPRTASYDYVVMSSGGRTPRVGSSGHVTGPTPSTRDDNPQEVTWTSTSFGACSR